MNENIIRSYGKVPTLKTINYAQSLQNNPWVMVRMLKRINIRATYTIERLRLKLQMGPQ